MIIIAKDHFDVDDDNRDNDNSNKVFRFSSIFSNSAISLRIRPRGKKYLSDIVLEYIIFAC